MRMQEQVAVVSQSAAAATETVLAYHRAIDTGHATDAISLFTEDAVFQARGTELVGRDAISGFMTDREAQVGRHTVHVVANVVVRRGAGRPGGARRTHPLARPPNRRQL